MKTKVVGIVGGTGAMGQLFKDLFERQNHSVLISGRRTPLSHAECVQKSDVVIFTVPISKTASTIEALLPYTREDQLLTDFTSLKVSPVQSMMQSQSAVIGMHPMFGPHTDIAGQNVILTPTRPKEYLPFLREFLDTCQAKVHIMTPEKHDQLMAMIQGISHFSDIVLANTLRKSGFDFEEISKFSTPVFTLKSYILGRLFSQDGNLYANISMENEALKEVVSLHKSEVKKISQLIEKKDYQTFENNFQKCREYFNDFVDEAAQKSETLIDYLAREEVKKQGVDNATNSNFPQQRRKTSSPTQDHLTFDVQHPELSQAKQLQEIVPTNKTLIPNSQSSIPNSAKKSPASSQPIYIFGSSHSYTDLAARSFLGDKAVINYSRSISEICQKVDRGEVRQGFIPWENSINGSVGESLDGLFGHQINFNHLIRLKIDHALIAKKETRNIKKIISHPQSFGQCALFLSRNYPHIKRENFSDNASAIKYLLDGPQDLAAIGPRDLALALDLKIIQENIADEGENYTSFAVLEKKLDPEIKHNHIAISFITNNKPGALLSALEIFEKENINLTKIESRPNKKTPGEYIFFVNLEGGLNDKKIKRAFLNLENQTVFWEILGIFWY